MDKIKFIEETKIKREAQKEKSLHTNPIKANLMKFVHFKLHKSEFKKDFE